MELIVKMDGKEILNSVMSNFTMELKQDIKEDHKDPRDPDFDPVAKQYTLGQKHVSITGTMLKT